MPNVIATTADSLNQHNVVYKSQIAQELRTGLELEALAGVRPANHTYSAPNVRQTELLQAYQSAFTPKGTTSFDALEFKLQPIKVDVEFTADDLAKFYESWKHEWFEFGRDEMEWSFPRYINEMVLMPKIIEEMNYNAWHGTHQAPTAGTAGLSINSIDGYGKVLNDLVTTGLVTERVTGALGANTIVNQTETFMDSLPEKYRDLQGDLIMSPSNVRKYWRNYRAEFGTGNGVAGNANDSLRIDATNVRLRGVAALEGSDRILFNPTRFGNMIYGTRINYPSMPTLRWKDEIRILKGTAEFYRFYGFDFADHVFINDQN